MPIFFLGFFLGFGVLVVWYEVADHCNLAWDKVVECQEQGKDFEYCKSRFYPESCKNQ